MALKSFTVAVERKDRETTGSLLRRFNQYIQKSRVLKNARSNRFRASTQSRVLRRRSALVRNARRAQYQKLQKLGKVK